jgi:UDP-4-amino-4-deoxy-L-arabinose-oxoglutarate aminotransferase
MKILGTKANLPDILSCLLPSQIDRVYINRKKRINAFKFYNKILSDLNLRMQFIDPQCASSFHLYPIHVNPKIRNNVIRYLNKNGVSCTVNYQAITSLTYYRNKYKILPKDFPISSEWGEGTISLPFYPEISKNDQIYVANILKKALKKYV